MPQGFQRGAFQANAFQVGNRLVDKPAPTKFSIDSNLELPADEFTAEVPNADWFLYASKSDRITLSVGLEDVGGVPYFARQIVGGIVDEYSLSVQINAQGQQELVAQIRGRDPVALVLDRPYVKRFVRYPARAPVASAPAGTVPAQPLTGQQPDETGIFKASVIVEQIVKYLGLQLSWQCADFEVHEDFACTGRAIDSIMRLVEPWQAVPPFRADVYMLGETLVVRQRPLTLTPEWVFDVKDARLSRIQIRKRQLRPYGRVVVSGKLVAFPNAGRSRDGGAGWVTVALSSEEETVKTEHVAYATTGKVTSRVVEEITYRMPDRIVLHVVKRISDAQKLLSEEESWQSWDESTYDEHGPIGQPLLRGSVKELSAIALGDSSKAMQVQQREVITYTYDSGRFLKTETTVRSQLDLKKKKLVDREMLVRTLADDKPGFVRETLDVYKLNAKDKQFYLASTDSKVNAGARPGGFGSRGPVGGGGVGAPVNAQQPLRLEKVISMDADAVDVTFHNPHFDLTNLELLMTMYEAASGRFEFEVQLSGVGIPWMSRGSTFRLVGLVTNEGVAVEVPPLMVIDMVATVDESTDAPNYTQKIRATGLA